MYDDKRTKDKFHTYIISVLVNNAPGVLTRVASMFMKRNFNIDTLTVSPTVGEKVSRMTISFTGNEKTYEQMVKQLHKLIDVIKIQDVPLKNSAISELALLKVRATNKREKEQLMICCKEYRTKILATTPKDVLIELVGSPAEIDAFVEIVRALGLKELARTGVAAIATNKEL